jgi:hypothetical protein
MVGMNYFAHGYAFVHDPYFLAGTAVPDWLSVIDRRMRVKGKLAAPYCHDPDPRVASLAAGVVQHLEDDRWFHQTRAFAELNLQLTSAVRRVLPADDGFRPSFLGHILVEILLDGVLIAESPGRLEAYYAALRQVDAAVIVAAVNRMVTRPSERLALLIPAFCAERFLYDYEADEKLLARLNRVMRRVKLTPLPDEFLQVLPEARQYVRARRDELLNQSKTGETP